MPSTLRLPHLRPPIVLAIVAALCAGACSDSTSTDARVARVLVDPWQMTLAVGTSGTVEARAELESGSFIDGRLIHWSASDPSVASVDDGGRVTAVSPGIGRIAASSQGKSAVVYVSVRPAPVRSVRVTPASASILIGGKTMLSALAMLSTGDTARGRAVLWATSNAAIASVASDGTVQGIGNGTATLTATVDTARGSATVTVRPVPVAIVTVAPAVQVLVVTTKTSLTAATFGADSSVLSGRVVTWSSSTPTVATVSGTGVVTALSSGGTTITATSETVHGTSRVTVVPVPVSVVAVAPASDSLLTGSTLRLTAATLDSAGTTLGGRTVTWRTNRATVATVDATGLVTAVGSGAATISAIVEGRTGIATITVVTPPVARVNVTPTSATLPLGGTLPLAAATIDAQARILVGRRVTWLSGSPSIARVGSTGVVTALTAGTVYIFATSENQRGSALVTVR